MALTKYQIEVLRLLADSRRRAGVSYIAGGVALNSALQTMRLSEDIDVFHDSTEALWATWLSDRRQLQGAGHTISVVREVPSFVEAVVTRDSQSVCIQWDRDSAFRFFPLVEDDLLGLTLHPLDLAANKVLAMAGRLEPRDWVDLVDCHSQVQNLGFLAWAACGKDPGVNPDSLLADAARLRYAQEDLDLLYFAEKPPLAAELGKIWKAAVREAEVIIQTLPPEKVGSCVLTRQGEAFHGDVRHLLEALTDGQVRFHSGSLHGAWPTIVPTPCGL